MEHSEERLLTYSSVKELFNAAKPIASHWQDLAVGFGIDEDTLDFITTENEGDEKQCLLAVIHRWLDMNEALPSWKTFCVVVAVVNVSLSETIAIEHRCGYVTSIVSRVMNNQNSSPVFLSQSCGCGHCKVEGWMTGKLCRNTSPIDTRRISEYCLPGTRNFFGVFDCSRHECLCFEMDCFVKFFYHVSLKTWNCLQQAVASKLCRVLEISQSLSIWLKQKPVLNVSNCRDLQTQIHFLDVCFYNYSLLYFLSHQFLSSFPDLIALWESYHSAWSDFSSNSSVVKYENVFFKAKSNNTFSIEIDCEYSHSTNLTLSDIDVFCRSFTLAIDIHQTSLQLVNISVSKESLIVYFYYCGTDYLMIFKSLAGHQLKLISQIKAFKVLSLTDLQYEFKYNDIQLYNNSEKEVTNEQQALDDATDFEEKAFTSELELLKDQLDLLKKQSHMKDIELSRKEAELKEKEGKISSWASQIDTKEKELLKLAGEINGMKERKDKEVMKKESELFNLHDKLEKNKEALELWKRLCLQSNKDQEKMEIMKLAVAKEMRNRPFRIINLSCGLYQLAVNINGDIVATEQDSHSVTILRNDGQKLRSIGVRGTEEGSFEFPFGIAVSNDGHILVSDYHRIQKLTYNGEFISSVGKIESGSGELEFTNPCGIAVHRTTGQIFIADQYNNRIQVLNADLSLSGIITVKDNKQFSCPRDIALDNEGHVYVAEWYNHCITKVTTTGQYVARFGSRGSAPGQLYTPSSIAIYNHMVYISEWDNHRLSVFDTQGRFLYCVGRKGNGEGEFSRPWGVAVDSSGNVYISDRGNKRIVIY